MAADHNTARLAELQARIDDPALPPVHDWHPRHQGEIDIRIAADGQWYHEGRPIRRARLVALFSRILRRDGDGEFYLVTPMERLRIQVDDAPFTAILLDIENPGAHQRLHFTTNTGERVIAGDGHRLWMASSDQVSHPESSESTGLRPYLHVRAGLDALLLRSVYYQLMDHLVERPDRPEQAGNAGERALPVSVGVYSDGCFMPLGSL